MLDCNKLDKYCNKCRSMLDISRALVFSLQAIFIKSWTFTGHHRNDQIVYGNVDNKYRPTLYTLTISHKPLLFILC